MKYSIGDRVIVSNGQPKPPVHHKAKLRDWRFRNFTGTVKRTDSDGYYLERDSMQGGGKCIRTLFHVYERQITGLVSEVAA